MIYFSPWGEVFFFNHDCNGFWDFGTPMRKRLYQQKQNSNHFHTSRLNLLPFCVSGTPKRMAAYVQPLLRIQAYTEIDQYHGVLLTYAFWMLSHLYLLMIWRYSLISMYGHVCLVYWMYYMFILHVFISWAAANGISEIPSSSPGNYPWDIPQKYVLNKHLCLA